MDYDVLILGGGLVGCAIAYELSKYNLNIALIEKNYDIGHDISLINTAVIFDGIESEDSLTAKLERMGNLMLDKITSKFNVPFKRCGTLLIAKNEEEEKKLNELYNRAIERGIKNIVLLDKEYVYEMEPNLKGEIVKALYSKNTGTIAPYDLALAYGEIAFDNNVNFKLEEEVKDIKKVNKGFKVITSKNKFTCKLVINTIKGNKYNIDKETKKENKEIQIKDQQGINMKYLLLNNNYDNGFSNIIFSIGNNKEKMYLAPTVHGKTMGAVSTDKQINNIDVLDKLSKSVKKLTFKDVKSFYDSSFYNDKIVIDDSNIDKGYIKISGKHYGLVTMTPAISSIICETIISNLNCKLKKDFIERRREYYRFKELTNEQRDNIIKMDKRYGKMICICNQITEGEIIDSIRRPLGARTIEGVKRRTGAAFGNCYGAQCINKIIEILARETNKKITEVVKDSKGSRVILNRIKEFDQM